MKLLVMKRIVFFYFALFFFITISNFSMANNVRIENIVLTNDSTLTFSISWDNSWRNVHAPGNHDAVWVFIKHRGCGGLKWEHADLSPDMNSHEGSGLLEVYVDGKDLGPNAKGVFIRRRTHGSGNIVNQTISLRLSDIANGEFDFKVFGVEMIQVPEGAFYLGDGNSVNTNYNFKYGNVNTPYLVSSENTITAGAGATDLACNYPSANRNPRTMPAAYPKGFKEFYAMKYELSQHQYVEFLNCLTSDQVGNRYARNATSLVPTLNAGTNGVQIGGLWPELTTQFPHRAMTFLSWQDLLAYLDWACLRPMTELEYEKLCRGPVEPVMNEKAWGTSGVSAATVVENAGTPTENSSSTILSGNGFARVAAGAAGTLMRCGFAAKPTTDRLSSGAGYYGGMELTGNAVEMTVNCIDVLGVAYTGLVGDGELTSSPTPGFANVPNWPQVASGESAVIGRGGAFNSAATVARLNVSNREGFQEDYSTRTNINGGRGVR